MTTMRNLLTGFILAAAALIAGCGGSGGGIEGSNIRVINAVIDGETIDLLVGDDVKATGVAPGATSAYAEFSAGSRTLKVRSTATGAVLAQTTSTYNGGARFTVFVHGKRGAIFVLPLTDDTGDASSGKFKLRLIGLSPDTGTVDVYVGTADIASATPAFTSVGYGTTVDFLELDPGTPNIVVTTTGTKDVVFRANAVAFTAGEKATLVIVPSTGGRLVNASVLRASGATALANTQSRLKAVNGVAGSAGLDYKVDGSALHTGIFFGTASSGYLAAPAGARSLSVEASNAPGTALATASRTLEPARDYTMLAWGTLAAPQLTLLADDNSTAPSAAKVRFVNALADASRVDVLVNFVSRASSLAPGSVSPYAALAGGASHAVTFTTPGGTGIVASLDTGTLASGGVYTVYLFGTASAPLARLVADR